MKKIKQHHWTKGLLSSIYIFWLFFFALSYQVSGVNQNSTFAFLNETYEQAILLQDCLKSESKNIEKASVFVSPFSYSDEIETDDDFEFYIDLDRFSNHHIPAPRNQILSSTVYQPVCKKLFILFHCWKLDFLI